MKPVQRYLWTKLRPLKIVPMDNDVDIPLTPQLVDPLGKEFPEPLLEPIQHRRLDVFIPSEYTRPWECSILETAVEMKIADGRTYFLYYEFVLNVLYRKCIRILGLFK
jgi:hypothetical protein